MFTKRNIIIMSVAIGALLIFIVGLLLWRIFYFPGAEIETPPTTTTGTSTTAIEAAKQKEQADKNLVGEIKDLAGGNDAGKLAQIIETSKGQAVVIAPNSNPIAVDTGEVLTRDGSAIAEVDTRAGDANAILPSGAIDPSKLPASTIRLYISPTAITPAEFSVSRGQAVSLAITAGSSLEIFSFEDPSLAAVTAGVEAGKTVVLVFNAPAKAGEYVYFSKFLSHRAQGSVGKMIVK